MSSGRARSPSPSNTARSRIVERTGIQHLPNEILAQIFMETAPIPPPWWDNHSMAPDISTIMFDILTITHVNRLWRSLALDLPGLWCYVTFGDLDLVETAIARSARQGSVLLDFGFNQPLSEDIGQCVLDIIQRALPCTKSLSFLAESQELRQLHQVLTQSDCSNLTSLRLGNSEPQMLFDALGRADIFAPNLQTLHMDNCLIWWTSSVFHAPLTELSVSYLPAALTINTDMIDALANLPTLRYLSLNHKIGSIRGTNGLFTIGASAIVQPTISMPRLEYLFFSGRLQECICFLNFFVVPSDALVCLKAESLDSGVGGNGAQGPDVRDTVANHFERRTSAVCTEEERQVPRIFSLNNIDNTGFRLDINRWGLDEFCGSTSPTQGLHQKQTFGTLLSVDLDIFGEELDSLTSLSQCLTIVRSVCPTLPAEIDTLLVGQRFSVQVESDWWMAMSSLLPQITTIVLEDHGRADLRPPLLLLHRDTIARGSRIHALPPDSPDFCPRLKTLIIVSNNIFRQRCRDVYSALLQGLRWRQDHVEELQLKVIADNVGDDQLAELQSYVKGEVRWTKEVSDASYDYSNTH
ncbi:hypothetical protein EVG20_g6681 [Dentipellis fragilis]|uniref:Uncharacterized protein n=1 Tax=Dentipellis fragilis TaxID=205917 RepID=A0A4Y9YKM5_9AGAM|nr:hypothetical protein EVG20_g6681 [Dentipellis fragilis]